MTVDRPAPADVPKLPELDPGVTLLETQGNTTGALHSLVLDHLLLSEGDAYWVDARGNATTTLFSKLAPGRRILRRIEVARGFTAFQHYSLVEELPAVVDDETSLIVVPAVEWFYESDDLVDGEGETMLEHALDVLGDVASASGTPVLVSRQNAGGLGARVDAYCTAELECVETRFGPRFTGEEFETLFFDCDGGVQTTLAFWKRLLARRHAALSGPGSAEVSSVGAN